jgi:uncharacterized protein (TIGR00255 family)
MTGYASVTREFDTGRLQLELRSVNSRFLDINFRIPDDLRAVEPGLREMLTSGTTRGKVECRISVPRPAAEDRQPVIDRGLLAQLVAVADEVRGAAARRAAADGGRPDALARGDSRAQRRSRVPAARVLAAGKRALAEFVASRQREGARLARAS